LIFLVLCSNFCQQDLLIIWPVNNAQTYRQLTTMEGDFHTECWNEGIIDNLRQQLKDLSSDDDDYGRVCDKLQMHEQMTDHTRNVLIAISKAAREDKAYLMPVIGPMFVVSCVSIVQSVSCMCKCVHSLCVMLYTHRTIKIRTCPRF
jgi:hypothetical protein